MLVDIATPVDGATTISDTAWNKYAANAIVGSTAAADNSTGQHHARNMRPVWDWRLN
jgi:hypothetical protein